MREITRLLARLMIVCLSGAALITGCGERSEMETAAETGTAAEMETAASETAEESVSEPEGEEKTARKEKPRLVENDEEEATPDRTLMKANQVQNEGDEIIYPVNKDKKN